MPTTKKQEPSQATILDGSIGPELAGLLADRLNPKCKRSNMDITKSNLTMLLVEGDSPKCTLSRADKVEPILDTPQIKKEKPSQEELWVENVLSK